ncbi:MAG: ATP-binding protein, partial [Kiritimatiellae bacterium]|nr:ATP-binding protein [Kiritimatiellia bacterium]
MTNDSTDIAAKALWERARTIYLSTLMSDTEKNQAENYFSMITSVTVKDGVFTVYTSNPYAADFLKTSYSDKLKGALDLAGADPKQSLDFQADTSAKPEIVTPAYSHTQPGASQQYQQPAQKNSFISTLPLDENYTFEEFVQGPSNSWAYAAAKGVSNHPGQRNYNPLFIHGGTGLGKTHLMQAIGNDLKKRNPGLSICYLTAETFLNEYVNSLQNKDMDTFRYRYRNIDVLLVDDIQFLQKGKQCQEE